MKPRAFKIATALSLLLFIPIGGLWIRGHYVVDEIYLNVRGRLCIAGSFPNHIHIILYRRQDDRGPLIELRLADKHVPPMPIFWEFNYESRATERAVSIPHWLLISFTLAIPTWAAFSLLRKRNRLHKGCCPTCGYDLRATPHRCPECGEAQER